MISNENVIIAIIGGITPSLIWIIARYLTLKFEKRLNERQRNIYKKFIFVWGQKDNYKLIVPILLFSMAFTLIYLLTFKSSGLLVLEVCLILELSAALLKKDKTTVFLNAVTLIIFLWAMAGGFADATFPFLHNWEIFKHNEITNIYNQTFFLNFIAICLVFFFGVDLFIKPRTMLNIPTLSPLEKEKVQEYLNKTKKL